MIAIDLFSGAGGLATGLAEAGFTISLANEICPTFSQTYSLNHPHTKMITGDIQNISFRDEIESLGLSNKVDLVFGGPPCQGFSTAGKKVFDDPRNKLFTQFLRVIDEANPRMVLFENVSGFKNLYSGVVFQALKHELELRNYKINCEVIDMVNFGLPQHRKRLIIIAHKSEIIPFPKPVGGIVTLEEAISDLPPLSVGGTVRSYTNPPLTKYQEYIRNGEITLREHNCSNYGDKMQEILSLVPIGGDVRDLPESLQPKSCFKNAYARLVPNLPSPTITRNFGTPSSARCILPYQNRALSTREGARLQSFKDTYLLYGSKTQKNLQIGNAVPPLLGKIIGEILIKY